MAGYMPDDVFEAGAYAVAAIHVTTSVTLLEAVDRVYDQYKSSYKDDEIRQQWAKAAETIVRLVRSQFSNPERTELASLLENLVSVVLAHEPNGERRRKTLFGGTLFNKQGSPNYNRNEIVERNFSGYVSLLDSETIGQTKENSFGWKHSSSTDKPLSRETAVQLMEKGNFSKALQILLQLRKTEADWDLFFHIGQCYRHLEEFENGVRWLEAANEANPEKSQVLMALGIVYQLQERFEEAIDALEAAINSEPTNFAAYNSLGLTYKIQGQLEEALQIYEKAAEGIVWVGCESLKEEFTRETNVGGERTLDVMPGYEEALLSFLRSSPLYATVQSNIGICLAEMGQSEAARDRFIEAIQTTPEGYDYPTPREALRFLDEEGRERSES